MWITCVKVDKVSQLDLMKLFAGYDGEISEADFTPEELQEYLDYVKGE